MNALTVNFNPIIELTDEQFFQLCQVNRDLKFERNANRELIIMPPTGGETGRSNFEIAVDLGIWNRKNKLGVAFDSSTCFKLPNGADRSPDAAWIKLFRVFIPRSHAEHGNKLKRSLLFYQSVNQSPLCDRSVKMKQYAL